MLKRHRLIICAAAAACSLAIPAAAIPSLLPSAAQAASVSSPQLVVNGQVLPRDPAAPYLLGGIQGQTVYAPAKPVLSRLGYTVDWDASNQELVASKSGQVLRHKPGSAVWRVNEYLFQLVDGSQLIDSTCWVPVQPLVEILGATTVWSSITRTLYVKPGLAAVIADRLNNDSLTYAGEMLNGKRQGMGKLLLDGAVWYEGHFTNDQLDGLGELYEDGRLVYEGAFQANQPNDKGTLYYPDGRRYAGDFKNGSVTGNGTLYSVSGQVLYIGDWVNGVMEGFGYFYNNGKVSYSGSIRSNQRSGQGVAFDVEGKRLYEGDWSQDVRSGKGRVYTKEGKIAYDGEWSQDRKNGSGYAYTVASMDWHASDETTGHTTKSELTTLMTEQKYTNDRLVQEGRTFAFRGDMTDDGIPNGHGQLMIRSGYAPSPLGLFSKYGNYYEGDFKFGQMTGYGMLYDEQGRMAYNGEMADGKREGRGKSFENGVMTYEGGWRKDAQEGTGRRYVYDSDFTGSNFDGRATVKIEEGTYASGYLTERLAIYRFTGDFVKGIAEGYGSQMLIHDYKDANGPQSLNRAIESGWPIYYGQYKNGLREGTGKLYESNRLVYEGDFTKGVREGTGKAYETNLDYYEGTFSGDVKSGTGKLYNQFDHLIYDGDYKEGKKNGRGKQYDVSGYLVYEGEFRNDMRDGFGIEYVADGKTVIYSGPFRADQRLEDYWRDHPEEQP